jgi:hypothetical protein
MRQHTLLAVVASAAVLRAAPALADPSADPCGDALTDPVPPPVRDAAIDAQRAACTRDALSTNVEADVLIDTPGYHGEVGGDWWLAGHLRVARPLELSAAVRAVRYAFAQNAVNKATDVEMGPLTLGGAYITHLGDGANAGLSATLELPYTREDTDTIRTSGDLTLLASAALRPRTFLHARLGTVWMSASSAGGTTTRIAARAGADLVRRQGRRLALGLGADVQAGWYGGLDHVNVRVTGQWRMFERWRCAFGIGLPVGGDERTNAIVVLGLNRDWGQSISK